jgi:hypothetical protein
MGTYSRHIKLSGKRRKLISFLTQNKRLKKGKIYTEPLQKEQVLVPELFYILG